MNDKLAINEKNKDRMKGYGDHPGAYKKAGRMPKHGPAPTNVATGKGSTFGPPANKR